MRTIYIFSLLFSAFLLLTLNACTLFEEEPESTLITVPEDDPYIPGATLAVPDSELAQGTEFTITGMSPEGSPSSTLEIMTSGSNLEKSSLYVALMDRSMNGLDVHLGHPIFGPVVGASKAEFTGPIIALGPSGIAFDNPVTVTVPIDVIGITDSSEEYEIIPILQDEDGKIEIPEKFSIDFNTGIATVELNHFSLLRWVKNYFTAISSPFQIYTQVQEAKSQLPLPEETFKEFLIEAILCSNNEFPLEMDEESLPSMSDLLMGLFQGTGPGADGATTKELKEWLWKKYDTEVATSQKPKNYLKFSELFNESLRRSDGNIFLALANANAVLSVYRTSVKIDRTMENYRGDGNDETGARYHFFGAALHSMLYHHVKAEWEKTINSPITSLIRFTDPSFAVTVEEAVVSGDIISDTKEYAVDLNGVAFGKLLFEELFAKQQTKEQLMSKYGIKEEDLKCDHLLVGNWTGSKLNIFNCDDPDHNETIFLCGSESLCYILEFRDDRTGTETATLANETITVEFIWQETGENTFKACTTDGSECHNGIIQPPNKIVLEGTYEGSGHCDVSSDFYKN